MRTLILSTLLLTACSKPAEKSMAVASPDALAGLYERAGVPDRPSRICISGEGASMRFGINTSFEGPQSCTARGAVRRDGPVLTLRIDGSPACTLKASTITDGLTLNVADGPECAYYCGTNTSFDPGDFRKVGSTAADTRKAVDLVGEPLCS